MTWPSCRPSWAVCRWSGSVFGHWLEHWGWGAAGRRARTRSPGQRRQKRRYSSFVPWRADCRRVFTSIYINNIVYVFSTFFSRTRSHWEHTRRGGNQAKPAKWLLSAAAGERLSLKILFPPLRAFESLSFLPLLRLINISWPLKGKLFPNMGQSHLDQRPWHWPMDVARTAGKMI